MNYKIEVKKMVLTAFFIAVGIVLPIAMHNLSGRVFLPMHIPVLICGLALGWKYGLICGALTPVLSSLLTQMPPMAYVPSMLCELSAYGFTAGILRNYIKPESMVRDTYIALIIAMIVGRVVFGVMNAVIFNTGDYSFNIWFTSAFVTALPGIIIQLVIIPPIIVAMCKSKLIEF